MFQRVLPAVARRCWLIGLLVACALGAHAQTGTGERDLQMFLDAQLSSGITNVVVPPGIYRASLPTGASAHVTVRGAQDVTIDATGVTLVCTDPARALEFIECRRVKLKGLRIDYDPLPWTQGIVERVDPGTGEVDIRLSDGYPGYRAAKYFSVMEKNGRRIRYNTDRFYGSGVELPDRLVRFTARVTPQFSEIRVGDPALITFSENRSPHGLMLTECAEMTLEDVVIHAAPSFAILESGGDGANRYVRCRIARGPPPAGASMPRMLTATADGIHSISTRRGPVIDSCLIEMTGDDAIAFNGYYMLVVEAKGRRVAVSENYGRHVSRPGDRIRRLNQRGQILGEARLVAVEEGTEHLRGMLDQIKSEKFKGLYAPNAFSTVRIFMRDEDFQAEPGDVLSNIDRICSGFEVRNTTIRDHRARGILVKSADGVIERNLIDGSHMSAMALSVEAPGWVGSDYARNVLIRENVIRNCGYAPAFEGTFMAGIITVASKAFDNELAPAGSHRRIRIIGNYLERNRGIQFMIASASDVRLEHNVIESVASELRPAGSRFGIDPASMIWIDRASRVRISSTVAPPSDGNPFQRFVGLGRETEEIFWEPPMNLKNTAE